MKTIPANGEAADSKQQENILGSITQLHPWPTPDKQYGDKLCLASDAFFFFFSILTTQSIMYASAGRDSFHPYELLSSSVDSKVLLELKGGKEETQSITTRG